MKLQNSNNPFSPLNCSVLKVDMKNVGLEEKSPDQLCQHEDKTRRPSTAFKTKPKSTDSLPVGSTYAPVPSVFLIWS